MRNDERGMQNEEGFKRRLRSAFSILSFHPNYGIALSTVETFHSILPCDTAYAAAVKAEAGRLVTSRFAIRTTCGPCRASSGFASIFKEMSLFL